MPRKALVAAVVVGLLAVLAAAGVTAWRLLDRSTLERAVALAPEGTARYGWTDWRGLRTELGADLELEELLGAGFDADLTPASSMVDSAVQLHEHLALSPLTVEWELFAQSEEGAVTILGLPDGDFDGLADRLAAAGYEQSDGVWTVSEDLLPRLGLSAQFKNLALEPDDGVVRASDRPGYLFSRVELGEPPQGVADVVSAVTEEADPLAVLLYTGAHACAELAMSHADDVDEEVAEDLVGRAGEVHPLTGFAMAAEPGGGVLVAMGLADEQQARTDADSRSLLASGAAPGQGGEFADRFRLGEVRAEGRVVTMELRPVEGSYLLSDLATGPLLFATC